MQQMVHSATLHDHRLGVRPGLDPPTFAHVLRNQLIEANAPNCEAGGRAASGATAQFAELCLVWQFRVTGCALSGRTRVRAHEMVSFSSTG
jgi:hypothetical protein